MMNERISELRKFMNLTQEQFGLKMGISKNYVNLIENGKKNPGDRLVSDICREFNINEEWLRTGKGDMHKEPTEKTADIVSELIEGDTPFNDIIKEIMNTYIHLDSKSKEALQVFSKELLNNLREKKED